MEDLSRSAPYACSQRMTGDRGTARSRIGLVIGVLGLIIGAAPLGYAVQVLWNFGTLIGTLSPSPQSVETMGLSSVAFWATGVGFAVFCPLALLCGFLARQLGSRL